MACNTEDGLETWRTFHVVRHDCTPSLLLGIPFPPGQGQISPKRGFLPYKNAGMREVHQSVVAHSLHDVQYPQGYSLAGPQLNLRVLRGWRISLLIQKKKSVIKSTVAMATLHFTVNLGSL